MRARALPVVDNGKYSFKSSFVVVVVQNQNQNSLLVKRQNDNTSPGDWPRKISP